MPPPEQISFDPAAAAFSLLLLAGFLLLALFPSTLFNKTYEENHVLPLGRLRGKAQRDAQE